MRGWLAPCPSCPLLAPAPPPTLPLLPALPLLLGGLRFVVLHTKGGLVRWFKVTPAAADESATNS